MRGIGRNNVPVRAERRVPCPILAKEGLHDIVVDRRCVIELPNGEEACRSHRHLAGDEWVAGHTGLRAAIRVVERRMILVHQRGPPFDRGERFGRGEIHLGAFLVGAEIRAECLDKRPLPVKGDAVVPAPLLDRRRVEIGVGGVASIGVQCEQDGGLAHILVGPTVGWVGQPGFVKHILVVEDNIRRGSIGKPPQAFFPTELFQRAGVKIIQVKLALLDP